MALLVVPTFASAATADFRALFDTDNNTATGCTDGPSHGVEQILVTRITTTDTSAQVTRMYRQVCTGGVFGAPVDLDLTARPAGFNAPSGLLNAESRIAFSALTSAPVLPSMHLTFDASDGFSTQRVLTKPNGDPIRYPVTGDRRHSANAPGQGRNMVLDGQVGDWNGIEPLVVGVANDGSTAVRILKVYAFANPSDNFLYFRFDGFVDNSNPYAQDDSYARKPGEGLAVPAPGVLANDADPTGKPLTASPVSPAQHGDVTLNPDGSFTYTPDDPTSSMTDKFNYKANNGTKDSNVAQVTIKVSAHPSQAPTANDDAYTTPEDVDLAVPAPGVLANDVDSDGPSLTATLLSNPAHGTVVLASNGAFTYSPANNFSGSDTFTYRVSDGTNSDDATVTITISNVNDAPHANPVNRTTNEEQAVSVTLSATDTEPGTLTYTVTSSPANGSLSGTAPNLTYTPAPNFFGTDTFTYTATDAGGKVSNTATVTITVNPVNDPPSFTCGPNVLGDSTAGAASFPNWATAISVGPGNESSQTPTFEVIGNTNSAIFSVQPSVSSNGTLSFTPAPGANGSSSITVRLRDSGGTANGGVDVSANCVFTITVDAAPAVTTTTPANGATGVAANANITVNFSEAVNATGSSFTISCATSGAHAFTPTASPSTTFTLDPGTDFTQGEVCTVTVVAAQVSDVDANDPPNTMTANYVFSFTVDAAPSVTTTTPADGATGIAANANVVVNFSESVNAAGASFDINCATSGAHAFATSASPSATFTLDPAVDFTQAETCTVTVFAAGITDADANDPPDNMLANYVFSFTVDAAPAVAVTCAPVCGPVVTPLPGATGVATNTNLTVTFTEPVTITNSSVTISCANTGAHTVAVSGGTTTWTIDPTADFGNGELCTATVLAAGVSDVDTNDPPDNMLANFVWSFTTDTPPSVTTTTPANAATASPDATISITFDEPVDATGTSFTINCTTSGAHTFILGGNPTTYTLDPNSDFTGGETCTVTVIANQVTDQDAGDPPDTMVANYVFSFGVDAAPSVTSTTPANAATQVAGNANIDINFSEPVNASGASFDITCGTSGAHAFATSASPSATFTLDPTVDFTQGETCTVTVFATGVTDVDAFDPPDNMLSNYVFTFTVDAAPFVSSTTPADLATNIGGATNVVINFSEPVNAAGASFDITCANSGAHTFSTSSSPSATFTLDPTADFTPGETCTVTVLAAGVTDADAFDPPDTMLANYVFSFTIDDAPSVTAVTPTDLSTGIATNTNLSVTFSEPVTITNSSITINCVNTGAHAVTVSGGPTTWTIDPASDFGNGEVCTATVLAAQVSDNDANDPPDNMLANFVWSFTTDNPPSVSSTTPANAGVGAPNSNIDITFDEAVNATGSSFTISCTTSGSHSFALSGGPITWTLDPDTDFAGGETCTVTVVAANVTDADAGDPPDNMAANYVFSFGTDAAPTVLTTSPTNGTTNSATDINIVITYSEPVTDNGTAYTILCTPSAIPRPFVLSGNGTAVHTLDPNTILPAGQTCTVNILATQISDVDANDPPDNMAANYSFSFSTDANPQIVSLSPNDASTNNAVNTNLNVTWTEPVTMTTVGISCTISGSHSSVLSTSDNITWTINPDTDFAEGETCTISILSASVTDNDSNDPPDNPGPDFSYQITTDVAPTVSSTSPANLSTQQAANSDITVTFSESVAATASSFTISCATSGTHSFGLSSSPGTSFTLNPDTDFTSGEVCTVTVVANQISDSDAGDPPDNLASNYVFQFTVDTPPSVSATTPVNLAVTSPATNVTVTFDEGVNATTNSFSISCTTSGAHSYALSGGPVTWTLNPDSDFAEGETCTVTVVAVQVTDTDAGDPPDTMALDYTFQFSIDSAPTVLSTSPVNGAGPLASNINIVITYSEPVTAGGTAYTLKCTPSNTARPFVLSGNGTAVHTIDPNTNMPAGQTCTVNILAAQITDVDSNDPPDNMAADYSFSFTLDANPQITATTPNDGATRVPINTNIGITWTEPVNMTTININCATSGSHTSVLSTSDNITWTANPDTDFAQGELCTIQVLSASVTDVDAFDPPDNPGPDVSWQWTTDVAPSVSSTTPADLSTQQANNADISITFSEDVNITTSSVTISCATSGTHSYALSGGLTTWTLNPDTDFTNGELCTVTVLAAQVSDNDAGDPPDNMNANYVFTFTVDTPPAVTATTPTEAQVISPSTALTVTFNESVNATTSSFTVNCGGNQTYTLSASPSTSFTLTPTTSWPATACTLTVIAAQITDADAGDPPDNPIADTVVNFTVNTPPTAKDDIEFAIGNLTLTVSDANGVIQDGGNDDDDGVGGNDANDGQDTDPDAGSSITIQNLGPLTGTAGGTLTFTSGGGYTYHSQAGDQSVDDVFTYTIVDNNGATDTGLLTIKVGPRFLFVDAAFAGAPRDGRDTNPFQTLQEAEAGSAVNDTFVVRQGAYSDFITLKNGQIMYGNGASAALTVTHGGKLFTVFTPTGTHPSLKRSTAGNTITLASNNNLRGIDVSASSAGSAISGTNFGTLTVTESRIGVGAVNSAGALALNNGTLAATFQTINSTAGTNGFSCTACAGNITVAGGTMSGATGATFNVSGGTFGAGWQGGMTQANAAPMISIAGGHQTGTLTFSTGTLAASAGTGLQFDNADGIYQFNGPATVNTATAGINIQNGSGGTFTFGTGVQLGNTGAITGTAFRHDGSTGGVTYAGNIANASVAAVQISNQTAGIIGFNTGTITSAAGIGVLLDNADGTVNFTGTANLNGATGISIIKGTGGAISFGANTSITTATAPVVVDGSGANAPAVTGAITYSGIINKINATGTMINVNTLSTPGSLVFNGTTLTQTANGAPGANIILANVTGTFTTNHLNLQSTNNNYAGTLVSISGTNTGGAFNFHHLTLLANGTTNTGKGIVASGGGTLTVNATGGNSTMDVGSSALDLSGQFLGTSAIQTITTAGRGAGTSGINLVGVTGNTLTITNGTILGNGAASFRTSGGSPSVTCGANITQNAAGNRAIDITTLGGGTMAFSGTITSTGGAGVSIEGTSGTVNISGLLSLSGTGSVFRACNGTCAVPVAPGGTPLTITATNANNTIGSPTAATATGLQISNATIGASGVQFDTVNVSGGTNGILLANTGNTGGTFVINGTGADNSGGLITGTTGDGVSLTNTRNITLTELQINSAGQSAIEATTVTNLNLTGTDFDSSADDGFKGDSVTNLVISGGTFHRGGASAEPTCNFHGFDIVNLLGTSSITSSTFTRSNTVQFKVNNTTNGGSQDTLTVTGTNWNTHTGPCSGDHLSLNADGTANLKLIMNASAAKNVVSTGGSGVQVTAGGGSGNMAADITGLQTSGNTAGVAVGASGTGNISFNVHGNKTANNTTGFSGTGSVALILTCTTSGTCQGQFDDNSINHTAGTGTNAIQVVVEGNGTGKVTVSNNVVSGNFQRGLHAQQRGGTGTGTLAIHVTGNTFTGTDAGGLDATNFETSFSGDTTTLNTMCLNLAGNTASLAGGGDAYRLFNRAGDVFQLQNFAGSGASASDVQTWVTTTKGNAGTPVNVTVNANYSNSAGCAVPTLP